MIGLPLFVSFFSVAHIYQRKLYQTGSPNASTRYSASGTAVKVLVL